MIFLLVYLALLLLLWVLFLAGGPAVEKLLAKGAHRVAAFRYRDYLPVLVVVAAGIGATAMAGDAFLDIAARVHAQSPQVQEIDATAHAWAVSHRTSGSTVFFLAMTRIGDPAFLAVLVGLVALALAARGRWRWAAYLVLASGIGGLLNLQLKTLFARARPELADALRDATGYSFPSGHAMGSTVVLGALAYLATRAIHRWPARAAALALCFSLILGIALSRVYLGVHWITDVGAGVAAGTIWIVSATVAYEASRRVRLVRALRARRGVDQTASSDRATRGE